MRIPVATYRVQFNRDFRFEDARALLPYLSAVGVTDLYASPIFRARAGSQHGYDITCPTSLNPELGTPEEFDRLLAALSAHEMGLVLDIVPNHTAASSENPWWTDVLENGPSSSFAPYFDINWDPAQHVATPPASARLDREEQILLPVLGAPYGEVLENQEIQLSYANGGFFIGYYSVRLPVDPSSYPAILQQGFEQWAASLWPDHPAVQSLRALIEDFGRLPPRDARQWEMLELRRRERGPLKRRLCELSQEHPEIGEQIRNALEYYRGRKGDPRSFDPLDQLLAAQTYVLAYWKVAREKINYRRFFDVSDLVGMRVEDEEVHRATHAFIYRLVAEGKATGLRIDHIDGLYDPQVYLERLRAAAPDAYVVVEKILLDNEMLPRAWPVSGTTGYDFLGLVNNLFVHPGGLDDLTRLYTRLNGLPLFEEVVYEQKKRVLGDLFAGEMLALGLHLGLLADEDRYARDLSSGELRQALVEVTACLPVYRTYVRDSDVASRDFDWIQRALRDAAARNPSISPAVFQFLANVLLLRLPTGASGAMRSGWTRFVMRWQQLTGPVMAKGVEDTALYVYNRLISLNDVGGRQTAVPPEEFHQANAARRARWPATMNATSTHDTKRSEDVRARINVLSEMPAEWSRAVGRWRRIVRPLVPRHEGKPAPDANAEYLIYQTLLGAWPFHEDEVPQFRERMASYVRKAAREAKVHTSWLSPDESYENCLVEFLNALLAPGENAFLREFLPFQRRVAFYGAVNSLAQVLLKMVSPGVPDFYQGSVLWDLSLVDPDNRRPVDFHGRTGPLDELRRWDAAGPAELASTLLRNWQDGSPKLYLTYQALRCRRANPGVFLEGDYQPVKPEGLRADHVVAFTRHRNGDWLLAAVPRLVSRFSAGERWPLGRTAWRDTVLPLPEGAPRSFRNRLTGETVTANAAGTLEMHAVLNRFPVALLTSGF